MRLSTVFELLLIFLLIAFAAYGRVIDRDEFTIHRTVRSANESRRGNTGVQVISLKQAAENVNKYCTCNANICNCCRNFNIPIVQLRGPGCASLQYLEKEKMAVQLSMGENILTSTIVDGKKPKAVCVPMPGGLTKFCGRIYSIVREADNHFKACLGLELQSSSELEAALRVSCFRFGPDGVKLRPAEQLPIVEEEVKPVDDDDDDLDYLGLGDDDDDDDSEDAPEGNAVPDSSTTNEDSENDDDDDDEDDVLGFDAFLDFFADEDESVTKKPQQVTTPSPILPFTIPILTKPTTGTTSIVANDNSGSNVVNPKPIASKPEIIGASIGAVDDENELPTTLEVSNDGEKHEGFGATESTSVAFTTEEETIVSSETSYVEVSSTTNEVSTNNDKKIVAESSDDIESIVKPDKPAIILKKVKPNGKRKKPSLTSASPNAIKNDSKKPLVSSVIITKPTKPNHVQTPATTLHNTVNHDVDEEIEELNDNDEDDDILETSEFVDDDDDDDEKFDLESDSDVNEDENIDDEKYENEEGEENDEDDDINDDQHEEEDVDDLIDDDEDEREEEEEEEAVLSALVEDDDAKVKDKVADNVATAHEEDDVDYGLGLGELLSRKRSMRSGRQSKVMRL